MYLPTLKPYNAANVCVRRHYDGPSAGCEVNVSRVQSSRPPDVNDTHTMVKAASELANYATQTIRL